MGFRSTPANVGAAGSVHRRRDVVANLPLWSPSHFDLQGDPSGELLPSDVTLAEIESRLDRVALAVEESPYGQVYVPLFSWLQYQRERKRRHLETMAAISERVRQLRGRRATRS